MSWRASDQCTIKTFYCETKELKNESMEIDKHIINEQ